jgi:uncharacterized membrane protein YkoI
MKPLFVTLAACAIGALAGSAAMAGARPAQPALALSGRQLSGQAKITLAQARTIAMKARPGAIVAQELEKEGGGSGLRYSFDVKGGGRTFEVGVDAKTGRVLESGAETATQEAAEAKADAEPRHH